MMVGKKTIEKIEKQAEELCSEHSLLLYAVDYVSGSKTLRVFVDSESGSIDIEDCAKISRTLSAWLDEEDLIASEYNLEVSSPGLERILTKAWHFDKVVGKIVHLHLYDRLENYSSQETALKKAKKIKGQLISFNDKELTINIEGADFVIPPSGVAKANLVFESV